MAFDRFWQNSPDMATLPCFPSSYMAIENFLVATLHNSSKGGISIFWEVGGGKVPLPSFSPGYLEPHEPALTLSAHNSWRPEFNINENCYTKYNYGI